MSIERRLLSALQGPGNELITGLLGVREQSKATDLENRKFNLLLAQAQSEANASSRKLTSDALGNQYKAHQEFYNTLMSSDDKSSTEFKVFADRAWSNLKEIENTYNKFHGISTLPQLSAMKIFEHEISLLPEGKTSWNDSLLKAIKRKPQYADVQEDVWKGVEVIWKASQPDATKSDKEAALTFKQDGSIASGDTSLAYGFDYVPEKINLGGPAFVDDFLNFLKRSSVKRDVSDAQALSIGLETSDERALRTGETSQLLPNSVIDALRQEDRKSIGTAVLDTLVPPAGASDLATGTGTGGMLSFNREDILGMPKTVDQVEQFLRQYQTYLAEFGEDQAEELLEAKFQTLDPIAQEEILKIISPDETSIETPSSGSGGGQVSEEAANFITNYMQILQNSNVDEAGKRTGSAFNLLPVEVQKEVVTILEQLGIGEVNSPIPLGNAGPSIDQNLAEGQRMGGILGMLISLGYPMAQQIGAAYNVPYTPLKGMYGGAAPALAGLAGMLAPTTANAPTETGTPLTSEQLQALANQ